MPSTRGTSGHQSRSRGSEIDDETKSFTLSSFSKSPDAAVGAGIMRALVVSESINMRLYLYALPNVFFFNVLKGTTVNKNRISACTVQTRS